MPKFLCFFLNKVHLPKNRTQKFSEKSQPLLYFYVFLNPSSFFIPFSVHSESPVKGEHTLCVLFWEKKKQLTCQNTVSTSHGHSLNSPLVQPAHSLTCDRRRPADVDVDRYEKKKEKKPNLCSHVLNVRDGVKACVVT